MSTYPARPASEKQVYWIDRLTVEKGISRDEMAARTGLAFDTLTTKTAGTWLDILFAAPDKADPDHQPVVEAGLYLRDGTVFKAQWNRANTNLYAKRLEVGQGFVYDGGAIRKLDARDKMTAEQARAFGVETGTCANCGEGLSDPISIDIGLGTSCGPKLMGREAYNAAKRAAKAKPDVAQAIAARKAAVA